MNPWTVYKARMNVRGGDRRNTVLQREQRFIRTKLPFNLSYQHLIFDGEEREMAVIDSDNLDIKRICSMPNEDIRHGGLVEWMDNHWLVIEKDANNEVYAKAKMRQCNYLLRWINDNDEIVERWSIVEDGTKYLTGEFGDNQMIFNRGDTRIALYLPRDEETLKLNRKNRFLIDDYDSPNTLAYRLTKPFKLGGSYNNNGVLAFVLTECNTEDTDNFEQHIANYYTHFPREDAGEEEEVTGDGNEKKVWL